MINGAAGQENEGYEQVKGIVVEDFPGFSFIEYFIRDALSLICRWDTWRRQMLL